MTTNIIGWIILVIISICGWYLSNHQNNQAIKAAAKKNKESVAEAATAAAIAATKEFTQVTDTVSNMKRSFDSLPCIKDASYMMESGKLMQQVENLQKGQDKLESKIDQFLLQMKVKC